MLDLVETLKLGATVVGSLGLGGGGVWKYMSTRNRSNAPKTSSPSQITESQAELVSAVNEQTKTILTENARLRRESNSERRSLKRAVAKISIEVAECNGRHEECETRVAGLTEEVAVTRAQIEQLMRDSGVAAATALNPLDPRYGNVPD